jgi:hypothetical protein
MFLQGACKWGDMMCVCGNYAAVDVTIGVQNTVGDALNQSDIWTFIRATGGGGVKITRNGNY